MGLAAMKNSEEDPKSVTVRFDALVRKVLSVPHEEILRREEEYKRQSEANPKKRGPKPKKMNETGLYPPELRK